MTDQQTIERLRTAFDTATRGHHLDPHAADRALAPRPRRAGRERLAVLAVPAAFLAVLAIALGIAALRGGREQRQVTSGPACGLTTAPLPTWARAGFAGAGVRTPHVVGDGGQIVAVPFGTLRAHQPSGRHNKVLWIAREPGRPLVVAAQPAGGGRVITRTLPEGTGPSYLDLPAAGCWQLTLTWPGHRDRLVLSYGT